MKRKLLIICFVTVVLGTLVTGVLSIRSVNNSYLESIKEKLISNGQLINSVLIKYEKYDEINFFSLSQKLSKQSNARVTFINDKGRVLADSENNSIIFYDHVGRNEVKDALSGKIGINEDISMTTNEKLLYVALPPIELKDTRVITRLSVPLEEINVMTDIFFKNIMLSILLGIIISVSIGYLYIDNITKPVKEITEASKQMFYGKFDKKLNISTGDEIEELANNFNYMAENLSGMINSMNENNSKLNAILKSMADGVIAIDKEENIIFMNPQAANIFNISKGNYVGKNLREVIDCDEFHEIVVNDIENKANEEREIFLSRKKDKHLKIYINSVERRKVSSEIMGHLILIHDITEMKRLESLNNEFIVNASHELRTPLTSIIGFIETLKINQFQSEEQRNKFINILEMEASRLKKLVDDLLTLSSIENNQFINKRQCVYVYDVVIEIVNLCSSMIESKKVDISVDMDEDLEGIVPSEDLFRHMILNLVDNAIKYSRENGKIEVKGYIEDSKLKIVVKDNGIGIPQDDLPKLFERFYRVDKARSRRVGGTGLGLAITKRIAATFEGEVNVNSIFGKGSEFTIIIPK